ncbi:DDE-type integrase/transposase/recombinase [Paracoccus sp. 1_MG-2023]|uniref:DDE-type integrase/transposase/recombinase n=1 Tax=unclassified Paracoccus (in: a-proteobacteria) TaxID=2688777 RepID=UPI001C086A4F|nr:MULTISPECIES: DDE-type integrase/transposase/recombinase [unclassified Paracoccus (in: a-proteobacteria)]MBU2958907.1 DDE-type integrase/transposase/recombinase [Paracoccus sp. C2R09]MDO6670419.1 DDE-type integrase/transposase/recombinase [Paracoccus sp. 1_MG-2023]
MRAGGSQLVASGHVPVEEGAVFELNNRRGQVAQLRASSCLVVWDEFVDPETGEVFPAISDTVMNEDFCRYDLHGKLSIVRRPLAASAEGERDRSHRTQDEIARMKYRYCYVSAAQQMVSDGDMDETRAGFIERGDMLIGLGTTYYVRYLKKAAGALGRRGGASVNLGKQSSAPKSAAIIHRWYCAFRRGGQNALFDEYARSGNRSTRYTEAEQALAWSVIRQRLDEERCSIQSIVDSVKAVFKVQNEKAASTNPPGRLLTIPGYDYVRNAINALAPLDHAVRTRGLKVAYRDMHALGVGVKTSRALERVEIDEYTFDLMVILRGLGVWDWLRAEERTMLGLDGSTRRVTLSAAIDVHTRCIVGMQIAAGETTSLLRDTVEMIFMDKTPIADAVGALEAWDMHGRPEMIVLDRGPNYVGDEVYDLLAALGIVNLGAPARKPWLRPFVERLFKTIHLGFAQRFAGRTFSNVVARGENDPAARVSLTLDEFLHWLVRWIVDIYHNTAHDGLLGHTPAKAWKQSQNPSCLQAVSREELRKVFGIRRSRSLGPSGITMMHIRYQTDELMRFFYASSNRPKELEVAWWPHDIGTISVKVAQDRWMNVTAADRMWIGKSFDDLMMVRHKLDGERDRSDAVKARALADLDAAAHRGKVLRGLLPTIVTDGTYDRYEADFMRFMSTAERDFDAPEYLDLFDGVIDPSGPAAEVDSFPSRMAKLDAPAPAAPVLTGDDEDLME